MKVIHCCDLGFECEGVVRAENEAKLLNQVVKHAQEVHQLVITPELVDLVKLAIKVED